MEEMNRRIHSLATLMPLPLMVPAHAAAQDLTRIGWHPDPDAAEGVSSERGPIG